MLFSDGAWRAEDIQRVLILVLAALGAVIARGIIHLYAARWKKRGTALGSRLVLAIEAASTPLLLVAAFYAITYALPVTPHTLANIQRALAVCALLMVMLAAARIVQIGAEMVGRRHTGMEHYIHPLRTLVITTIVLVGTALGLKVLEISVTEDGVRAIRIAGIALGSYFAMKIVQLAIAAMESMVDANDPDATREGAKRARTLGRVLNSLAVVVIVGIGVTMVLSEFGMNIMPIVTGAGIAGIALGFGAQNLVRDVISGFFLILENQVRVGDVVTINGTGGLVEAINLRTIVLRDLRGTVHVFPNGGVTRVSNMTKQWSVCVIDLGVGYDEDVDRVMKVLAEVGEEFYTDPVFKPMILGKLEVLGVDNFEETSVTIRVTQKTLPQKQWMVGRELRRRIKNRFSQEKIQTVTKARDKTVPPANSPEPPREEEPLARYS